MINVVAHQQLEDYFKFVSQKRANERAQRYWDELKSYDFIRKKDSVQVVSELADYELRLAVAEQWISLDNSRKHLFCQRGCCEWETGNTEAVSYTHLTLPTT